MTRSVIRFVSHVLGRALNVARFHSAVFTVAIPLVLAARTVGAQDLSVQRAGWLAGCWEMSAPGRVTNESWMAPKGGLMMGMSRTVVRDSAREFEHLRIETRAGKAAYVAHPSGQAETAFPAIAASDTLLVFSNPTHDFPQQISYRRVNKDSVVARIEGTRGGQIRGINFPMRRVGCAGEVH